MFNIRWEEKSLSDLDKLERFVSSRIYKKITELRNSPYSKTKRLKASEYFSLRVGDYRVLITIENNTIIVWKIGHRKNIYD